MAEYRVLWADIKTPTDIQGELPVESIFYSKVLNAPGAIGGRMPLDPYGSVLQAPTCPILPTTWYSLIKTTPAVVSVPVVSERERIARSTAAALFGPSAFGTARTIVYIERDGVILKGGLIWGHVASVEQDQITFQGEGWHSYFRKRTIQNTLTYTTADQDAIARGLIDHAQAYGGGHIGVTTTANLHGVTRDRSYPWHEGKNIGQALEQLAAVNNGFEFDYVSSYDSGGDPQTDFVTRYPTTGRSTEHVFELGVNASLVDYSEDGKSKVNQHRAFGAGFGTEIDIRTAFNSADIVSYPLLEGTSSHPDVTRPATLTAHAERALTRGQEPSTLITMSVFADAIPTVGSYEVGDRVRVTADRGYLQLDRAWYRIVAIEVAVDDSGEESTVVLAPLGLFT